ADEQHVLEKLLTYGPRRATADLDGQTLIVAPRPGTISPWSSKATDITHICGLANLKRVERVIAYTIAAETPLDADQLAAVAAKLHDRMTQVVFENLDACAALFSHETPRPMTSIPVLAEGRAALEAANQSLGLALAD